MKSGEVDTDVLIVGAGPVGLFLANECARRGLRYRIIETRASQSEHSKALAIFPRTLEIFDMAGLAAPFLEAANRVTSVAVVSHGRTLAEMRFAPQQSPYPFVAMVPQNITERLLVEQLQRTGGAVEYETKFVAGAEQDDHVDVTMDRKGEPIKLRRLSSSAAMARTALSAICLICRLRERNMMIRSFWLIWRRTRPFPLISCNYAPVN
jgi:2-polyprenyl-6-methoxyphenol hydroxylase-like FAD-dependent oxidoreductase